MWVQSPTSDAETAEINKAIAAGINVATWLSDSPMSTRKFYYGSDHTTMGTTAARVLTGLMGTGGGSIAVMQMDNLPVVLPFIQEQEGVTTELANHAGFTIVTTLPCTDTEVAQAHGCVDEWFWLLLFWGKGVNLVELSL